jgi:hypothetical protein
MSQETALIVLATLAAIAVGVLITRPSDSSDEHAVETTVQTFLDAIGHDGEKACLQLSREAQAELKRHEDANSCERAAESVGQRDVLLFDFNAIRFGPENQSARIPPLFNAEDIEDIVGDVGGESIGLGALFPPIRLEQGDGRWRITRLDWYFES